MQRQSFSPPSTDVVIVGGGPAGAAAALMLARSDISVVLLDGGQQRLAVGETLPPAVRPVLDSLGVRAQLTDEGHCASVGSWSAWGSAEPWGRDFIFNRFGHGWHLDRRRFDALLRAAARSAGARLAHASLVASEPLPAGGFRLHLAGGRHLDARIVLDASGRSAVFARQRGVRRIAVDRMVALVGYVARRPDAGAEPAASLVEATSAGWWYSAPLPQDRLIVAFMTDADLARGGGDLTDGWLDRLAGAQHTAARALRFGAGLAGPPVIVSAVSGRLERFGGADWLALGDAAATQDPLSSEGILLAMQSGIDGALAARQALHGESDALAGAAKRREAVWFNYLDERDRNYAAERRWPKAPFWQRRSPEPAQGSRHIHRTQEQRSSA
ncbi:tryptophan 7-halogenase [Bradyrhizobium oligotrophicum]|uniref:tryptophan 7-halogenase n=1 Tax=Bradyrhizobium oligotrophicum TaxID=44255 RepID=UPI003EB6B82D